MEKKIVVESCQDLAIIQDELKAYEISWRCPKGHINFQTVLNLESHIDICLKCGKHYQYKIDTH